MNLINNAIAYNNYNEIKKEREYHDNRLDYTLQYCKSIGISYKEFQRREAFGLIPKSILNRLNQNKPVVEVN